MTRLYVGLAGALVAIADFESTAATENPPVAPNNLEFELAPADRDTILMVMLKNYPILAASPGIKAAYGDTHYNHTPPRQTAQVVFYPHAESRGVKLAFEVVCQRDGAAGEWSCPDAEIRRYVKLDFQDFEVRVKGNIDMAGVLAITEATRPVAASAVADLSKVKDVFLIHPGNGGYVVLWGSDSVGTAVIIEAHLRHGGNPSNVEDWSAFALLDE